MKKILLFVVSLLTVVSLTGCKAKKLKLNNIINKEYLQEALKDPITHSEAFKKLGVPSDSVTDYGTFLNVHNVWSHYRYITLFSAEKKKLFSVSHFTGEVTQIADYVPDTDEDKVTLYGEYLLVETKDDYYVYQYTTGKRLLTLKREGHNYNFQYNTIIDQNTKTQITRNIYFDNFAIADQPINDINMREEIYIKKDLDEGKFEYYEKGKLYDKFLLKTTTVHDLSTIDVHVLENKNLLITFQEKVKTVDKNQDYDFMEISGNTLVKKRHFNFIYDYQTKTLKKIDTNFLVTGVKRNQTVDGHKIYNKKIVNLAIVSIINEKTKIIDHEQVLANIDNNGKLLSTTIEASHPLYYSKSNYYLKTGNLGYQTVGKNGRFFHKDYIFRLFDDRYLFLRPNPKTDGIQIFDLFENKLIHENYSLYSYSAGNYCSYENYVLLRNSKGELFSFSFGTMTKLEGNRVPLAFLLTQGPGFLIETETDEMWYLYDATGKLIKSCKQSEKESYRFYHKTLETFGKTVISCFLRYGTEEYMYYNITRKPAVIGLGE